MELFYITFSWILFGLILFYLVYYWKDPRKGDIVLIKIRKIWYGLFVFGALVFWTYRPDSIFTDFEKYAIFFIPFVLVDAFIFLNLYFSKLGQLQMQVASQDLSETRELFIDSQSKVNTAIHILNHQGVICYYTTQSDYVFGLNDFLQNYAEIEGLNIEIYPKEGYLNKLSKLSGERRDYYSFERSGMQKSLQESSVYFNEKKRFMLYPFEVLDTPYVLEIKAQEKLLYFDGTILGLLITIYGLVAQEEGGALIGKDDEMSRIRKYPLVKLPKVNPSPTDRRIMSAYNELKAVLEKNDSGERPSKNMNEARQSEMEIDDVVKAHSFQIAKKLIEEEGFPIEKIQKVMNLSYQELKLLTDDKFL